MPPPRRKEFRILSLSGGGYLGLYTAAVLADLEARAGEPLARRFDLIAGTSVGGILAMGLAFELPMTMLVQLFVERGKEIFSQRELPSSAVGRLIDLTRSVLGPKYSGKSLRAAMTEYLGKRTLRDALHHMVIPAVDVSRSQTKVFKTPHAAQSTGDEHLRAVDVAMAASAAPAYFPAVRIEGTLYADGGIFAVAPDQVALHEAEHFIGISPADVSMLSIGTATAGYQPDDKPDAEDGAVGWLSDGRMILTLISVQQQHVQAMMEDRLGPRYVRVDAPWPRHARLGIDVATRKVARILVEQAEKTMAQLRPDAIERLIGRRPA